MIFLLNNNLNLKVDFNKLIETKIVKWKEIKAYGEINTRVQ